MWLKPLPSFIHFVFILSTRPWYNVFRGNAQTVQLSRFRDVQHLFHNSFIQYKLFRVGNFLYVKCPAVMWRLMQPHTYSQQAENDEEWRHLIEKVGESPRHWFLSLTDKSVNIQGERDLIRIFKKNKE